MSHSLQALQLGDVLVRQQNGLFSLNDLHRAAGGESRHQPYEFLRIDQTRGLVAELNSGDSRNCVETLRGATGGTYACRELVIAYAAWISPAFHLKVIRHFLGSHDVAKTAGSLPAAPQTELDLLPAAPVDGAAWEHPKEFTRSDGLRLRVMNDGVTNLYAWNDVAVLLGYLASPSLPRRWLLDANDIKTVMCRTARGRYPTNFVTEEGLLRALKRCCKPEAAKFNAWLKAEVFPAVTTGDLPRAVVQDAQVKPLGLPAPQVKQISHQSSVEERKDRHAFGVLEVALEEGFKAFKARMFEVVRKGGV